MSLRSHRAPLSAAFLLASLAACAQDVLQPVERATEPQAMRAASRQAPDRHVLVLKSSGAMPRGLEARLTALGATIESVLAPVGLVVVSGLSDASLAEVRGISGVSAVEADERILVERPRRASEREMSRSVVASPAAPQTAIFYADQWNMRAIAADQAWAAGALGSPSVTVAILDTGIDDSGFDLAGRVDAARSASFMPEDDAVMAAAFPARPIWGDLDGHGTNVASQVASNALVYAGVTSRTRLMSVKVCSIFGYCSTAAIFEGIVHAVDNGADVINMSLGGGFLKRDCQGCTSVVNRVLQYAEQHGVTVVVAAGNGQVDLDHASNYFATFCSAANVLCVAATGPVDETADPLLDADTPSWFTNYGRSSVDLSAPGGNYAQAADGSLVSAGWIYSLCSRTRLFYDEEADRLFLTACSANPNSTYLVGYAGTSQAAPHVSGTAALLVERLGRRPSQIRSRILQGTDDVGQPGTDPYHGRGRLNVAGALGLE